jgi:hypothetical protein
MILLTPVVMAIKGGKWSNIYSRPGEIRLWFLVSGDVFDLTRIEKQLGQQRFGFEKEAMDG